MSQHPFFSELLALIREAVYFCDDQGRITYINGAAEKLDGCTLTQIRGRTVIELYGTDDGPLMRALRTGQPVENIACRYNFNGVEVFQISTARPIIIGGRVVGAYSIQRDVSKLKEVIENNLKMQRELFPTSISGSDIDNLLEINRPGRLVGEHPKFKECLSMAAMAAKRNSNVMLSGQTGTGKELFARSIHQLSPRQKRPFLAINCAAIPEALLEGILFGTAKGVYTGAVERQGLLEQAESGTLFLDELNSMTLFSQAKLLRVLEEKEIQHLGGKEKIKIDVRIISSSNVHPREAIKLNQIREDLFYRLAVINIIIPGLTERRSDIPLLADYFIQHYNDRFGKAVKGLSEEALDFFLEYPWPGNVRQLCHCLESAMNFVGPDDEYIRREHLPKYLFGGGFQGFSSYDRIDSPNQASPPNTSWKPKDVSDSGDDVFSTIFDNEKRLIIEALLANKGNVSRTARALNMHRQSLIYRIKKYGIK
jgi:arginine utilization regulatory protein